MRITHHDFDSRAGMLKTFIVDIQTLHTFPAAALESAALSKLRSMQ